MRIRNPLSVFFFSPAHNRLHGLDAGGIEPPSPHSEWPTPGNWISTVIIWRDSITLLHLPVPIAVFFFLFSPAHSRLYGSAASGESNPLRMVRGLNSGTSAQTLDKLLAITVALLPVPVVFFFILCHASCRAETNSPLPFGAPQCIMYWSNEHVPGARNVLPS